MLINTIKPCRRCYRYVSKRVQQRALSYIDCSIRHATTWKAVKPHIQQIVADIVFPIMCHTDADSTLWEEDPYEFVRLKYALPASPICPPAPPADCVGVNSSPPYRPL